MKRKIAAIFAADAVGYSRLAAADEEDTIARLASYAAVFKDFIDRFGGRIFNTAGDAILAQFDSAVDAVRCALDIQESLRTRNLAYTPSRKMNFRIGITIGDVVERDGDLLGDGVNIAARLESLAPGGGICISRSAYEAIANKVSVRFSDEGEQHLKNIPDPVRIYTFALPQEVGPPAPSPFSLTTRYGAVIAIVMVVLAGISGFLLSREQGEQPAGSSSPPAAQAAIPETETTSTDLSASAGPTSDGGTEAGTAISGGGHAVPPAERVPLKLPSSDPAARQALLNRHWIVCHEGNQPEEIMKSCTALVDFNIYTGPDLALIYVRLGRSRRDLGHVDDAIEAYSESIRLEPSARAYNDRGIAYYDQGQWDKAIDDYTQAIRLDVKYGEAFNNRAWTQVRAGRAVKALDDAEKAVLLLPEKAYAWDTRGHVYEALGNREAAIRDFRKAITLDKKTEGSRSGLKRLGAVH